MDQDADNTDIKALKDAVNRQQNEAFTHQSDVIQYVHDVKQALNQLVEKVVIDQEETTKLCADTRAAIDGHRESVAESAETEDSLRLQVSQLESERSQLNEKVEQYREKLEQAKSQLRHVSEQSESVKTDENLRVSLQNRLHEESVANEAARNQIAKLKNELEQLAKTSDEIAALREDLIFAKSALAETEERERATTEANEELSQQLSDLSEELETTKTAAESVSKHESEIATALEAARDEIETLRNNLQESQSRETRLNTAIRRLEDDYQREQNTANELRQELDEASAKYSSIDDEIEQFTNRIALLESTAQSNEVTMSSLKRELKDSIEAKERIEHQMDELRNKAKATAESERKLESRVEDLEDELEILRPLRPEVRQLHNLNSSLEIQLENVRHEKERLESEVASELSRGTKSRLAEQLAEALKEQELTQESAKDLRREVESLRKEVSILRSMRDAEPRTNLAFDDIAARQQLGELLLDSGAITREQLNNVVEEREENGARGRIGQLFVEKGFANEDVVAQALAHQMGVPFIRIEHNTVQHEALRLVSERLAELHTCIPICIEDGKLVVALENPMDLIAIENLERASELTVSPRLATTSDIEGAIKQAFRSTRINR